MSVNNLSDQLHWLLSVKPFVPPSVNYTTDIQTSTLPPFEDQEEDLLVSDEDLLQHDIDSETLVTSIETPSIPAAANRDAPMVRLRTEPSPSKKPRLVAQQSDPNPGRRNSNASREDGSNKTRGQSDLWPQSMPPVQDIHVAPRMDQSRAHTPQFAKPKAAMTPASRIEQVDLTGDSGGSRSTVSRSITPATNHDRLLKEPKTSKKRKSEEYEADIPRSPRCPAARASGNPRTKREATPEFPNIEAFSTPPGHESSKSHRTPAMPSVSEEAPPPYSTSAPPGHKSHAGLKQDRQRQEPESVTAQFPASPAGYSKYYSESSSTQDPSRPPSRGESRPGAHPRLDSIGGRLPSRTPEMQNANTSMPVSRPTANTPSKMRRPLGDGAEILNQLSPRQADRSITKSPKKRLFQRRAVGDSEDDEHEEELLRSPVRKSPVIQKAIKQKLIKPPASSEIDENANSKSSGVARATPKPQLAPDQIQTAKSEIQTSPQRQAPKEHPTTETKQQSSSQSIADDVSEELNLPSAIRDVDTILVPKGTPPLIIALAQLTPDDLIQHKSKLAEKFDLAKEDWKDAVDDEEEQHRVDDIEARMETLTNSISAMEALLDTRQKLCQFSHYREFLKNEAVNSLKGDNLAALKQQIKEVKDKTKAIEARTIELMRASGLDLSPTPHAPACVAVESTQAPPKQASSMQMIPDSTIAHTQLVQQTQAPPYANNPRQATENYSRPIQSHNNRLVAPRDNHRPGPSVRDWAPANVRDPRFTETGAFDEVEEDDFGMNDADEQEFLEHEKSFAVPQRRPTDRTTPGHGYGGGQDGSADHVAGPRNGKTPASRTLKPAGDSQRGREKEYKWSADVSAQLKHTFKLEGWRTNQLNAVNATLSGKHAFILMPTGGGKSLCYQLPSRIATGTTRGVTIVVSPLLSLMDDQTSHLKNLGIQACMLNGETDPNVRKFIFDGLDEHDPQKFVQLLYVTPEMLGKSSSLINKLRWLYKRHMLARIVIDEAHCVSQWGHDFRPDYKNLGDVCVEFQGVPIMALTATATQNVRIDVINHLKIQGCETFSQSFNRPNLFYEVRKKKGHEALLEDVVDLIKDKYHRQCGIIYCLSRKKCEDVAEKLQQNHGISAAYYHAHLDPQEKKQILHEWQAGRIHVIVATIAFGMGIDKPDVRFVVHHSLPKSLEGYYQETGRAGRDGKPSGCYLYYGYQDCALLKRQVEDGEGSREQKDRQLNMLRQMIVYCENEADCRRVQVLNYFNEQFAADDCGGNCDNCNSTSRFETIDFTDLAASAVDLVQEMQRDKPTILQCVDVFKGSKAKKVMQAEWHELSHHGAGADVDRTELERIFYRLLSSNALVEINVANKRGFTQQFVTVGPRGRDYQNKKFPVQLPVRVGDTPKVKAKSAKARKKAATARPESTFVSSPVSRKNTAKRSVARDLDESMVGDQADGSSRHQRQITHGYERDRFCVGDDEDDEDYEESDDGFEPVRNAAIASKSHRNVAGKSMGSPIVEDEELAGLEPYQRKVVQDFVSEGITLGKKIVKENGLRGIPFTETILRKMMIFLSTAEHQDELKQIPDISHDKVDHYGARYFRLIQKYKKIMDERKRAEQPVFDPNRQIVDLASDSEEQLNNSDDYGDAFSDEEQSQYFKPNANVQAFNARIREAEAQAPPRTQSFTSTPKDTWKGKRPGKEGKPRYQQKWPKKRASSEGVRKKRASSTSRSAARDSTGAAPRRGGHQSNAGKSRGGSVRRGASAQRTLSGAGGGIGMMPT